MIKKYSLIVLSIIVIAAGIYLPFRTVAYPAAVTVVTQEESRGKLDLTYPQIQGLSTGEIQDKFNQAIREEVKSFTAKLNPTEQSAKVNYKIEYNDQNRISVTLIELSFTKNAAHPMTYLRGFTMNSKTGEFYKLKDLFKKDSKYTERINVLIEQQISERQIQMLKPFKGIGDNQEFYLTAEGLVIYYQLYEYTPYYYSFLKFTIPYAQINDIMVTDE